MAEGGTDEDKEVTEALQELDIRDKFDKNDLEIFLSTVDGVKWPKEVRVQLLIFRKHETVPTKSRVWEFTEKDKAKKGDHAEKKAICHLNGIKDVVKVVFVQNYGPCDNCADLIIDWSKKMTVEVVYTKEYRPNINGLPKLIKEKVKCYEVTKWRWNTFLLWNSGLLPGELHWWSESYEDCEEALKRGLEQQGIEFTHSSKYLNKLLKEFFTQANIWRSGVKTPLPISQIVDKLYKDSLGEPCFNNNELELFLSPGLGFSPAPEVILQSCVYYITTAEKPKLRKSPVFKQADAEQAIENAISHLKDLHCADLDHVEYVVFFQNFLPWRDSVQSLKGNVKYKDCKIKIVSSQPYFVKEVEESLAKEKIELYQIRKWRWLGFLLWNADLLPTKYHNLKWWELPFEECEGGLKEGLLNAEINYAPSNNFMEKLLNKLVYTNSDTTNIKLHGSDDCLSIEQYVKVVFEGQLLDRK